MSCQVILKAEKCVLFGNHNASKIWLYQLLPASPFSSEKWNYFKMELDVDPRRDDDASPTSIEGIVYIKWQQKHSGKHFSK